MEPITEQQLTESQTAYESANTAWQADYANEELKKATTDSWAKYKETQSSYHTQTKSQMEELNKKANPEPPKAPDKYDLRLPEKSLLQTADMDKIITEAKALGWTNEEAQEFLNLKHQTISEYHDSMMAKSVEATKAWVEEVKKDNEVGGSNFNKSIELSKRVVDRFGSDAFKKFLNDYGFGNHPEMVRIFSRIGSLMSEDQLVIPGSQQTMNDAPPEVRMFPTMAEK